MLEYWALGKWDVDSLEKWVVDIGENLSNIENSPSKTPFQSSKIPVYHVRGKKIKP